MACGLQLAAQDQQHDASNEIAPDGKFLQACQLRLRMPWLIALVHEV